MPRPTKFDSGDVLQRNGRECIITSVFDKPLTRRGRITYFRCNAIGQPLVLIETRNGRKYFKGGLVFPSNAPILRHVRYEHLSIYLNLKATGGASNPERWISPNPPPIPGECPESYKSYLLTDEEWIALRAGKRLLPHTQARVRAKAGL